MKPNVKLRSNIYVRLAVPVQDDPEYRAQIHGREALRTLLDKVEIFDTPDRAPRWLTTDQLQEWNEVTRCAVCKTQVVGPVRCGQAVVMEFRCPHSVCLRFLRMEQH